MKTNKIKDLLKESGLSQASLAKKLGISRQQLHSILKENRKTKYSKQIAQLLNTHSISKKEITETENSLNPPASDIQRLPLVYAEDIYRICEGRQGINQLYKPFYNQWPFAKENDEIENHFCLRIQDNLNVKFQKQVILGAFQLYLPLKLESGQYFLVYLQDKKKLITGTLEINTETGTKSIVNNNGIDSFSEKDIILARCSQIAIFLQ